MRIGYTNWERNPNKTNIISKMTSIKTKERSFASNGNKVSEISESNREEDRHKEPGTKSLAFLINNNRQLVRDSAFKPRFLYNYGYDEKFYEYLLRYKEAWQDKLFYVDEQSLSESVTNESTCPRRLEGVTASRLNLLSYQYEFSSREAQENSDLHKTLNVLAKRGDKVMLQKEISFMEKMSLGDIGRNASIVNVGGHVVSSKWLPQGNSRNNEHPVLALSTVSTPGEMKNIMREPQSSLFYVLDNEKSNIKSSIQIWRYDTEKLQFALYKYLDTEKFGICANLSWLPVEVSDEENCLGVLSFTSSDGRLHLLKIETNESAETEIQKLKEPSLSYQLKLDYSNESETIKIISYDFLGFDKIIVGSINGLIAEFVLPYSGEVRNGDHDNDDILVPSFVQSVAESPVVQICVANPGIDKYFILALTTGVHNFVIEYKNFQQGRVLFPQSNCQLKPFYNHNLKVYVLSDVWDSVGYSFARHPHEKATALLKADGSVSTLHLSEVIGHPLVLIGSTFGEIHVVNMARKILNGSKATNKLLVPLKLWGLELNGRDQIVISGDYEVVPTEKPTKSFITPCEIIVSSIAWNEKIKGSSMYAASTLSGLLIVERLDPRFDS